MRGGGSPSIAENGLKDHILGIGHMDREGLIDSIKKVVTQDSREFIPFRVVAVLLYGSLSYGTARRDSDIDLLIVGEGIEPKRQRRGREIALIKRCLPGLPFDVLLLTRAEVVSNFKNHNPLFLDIAEDGIIIVDENSFLQDLIVETKDYLREKGIKRFGEGWVFPSEQGRPTFLSRVSNKDFSFL